MGPLSRVLARGRTVQWGLVLSAARVVLQAANRGWKGLTRGEQEELRRLTGKARAGPRALTPRERSELFRILRKAADAARG